MDNQIDLKDIIAAFKEQISNQAQEIAVLKATIAAMARDDDKVE